MNDNTKAKLLWSCVTDNCQPPKALLSLIKFTSTLRVHVAEKAKAAAPKNSALKECLTKNCAANINVCA